MSHQRRGQQNPDGRGVLQCNRDRDCALLHRVVVEEIRTGGAQGSRQNGQDKIAAADTEESPTETKQNKYGKQHDGKRRAGLSEQQRRDRRMTREEPAVEHRFAHGGGAGPAAGGCGDE